ncbi:unnamed protein product [Ilex paraguariensis]|uniref:Alpha/beta hydrolase fold-3 domain-containing protein n=1 Tax=Ilex paraguariensis TaxID=185542 RepID=A0ABC8UDC3_9AQUA
MSRVVSGGLPDRYKQAKPEETHEVQPFLRVNKDGIDLGKQEVTHEVLPYLKVYKDGTIERLAGPDVVPAAFDPQTGVLSKDIEIMLDAKVSARLYRPNLINDQTNNQKLPLVVYFHGGAFLICSTGEPVKAPEHPFPTAYNDSWDVLQWVASHAYGAGSEAWLTDNTDFGQVLLVGDSAGANTAHHRAIRHQCSNHAIRLKLAGIVLIHPYFWGVEPIGSEVTDLVRKSMVDKWWQFVCPSNRGNDDLLINPFANGAPSLESLECDRVLVCVAEKDTLRDRGRLY